MRGVVYGILGTAVVQGILTTFGLWLSGVPRPVLLGLVAGGLSVLPIGAPVVWIPASLWLIMRGHTGWGIFLFVYGIVAVSGADSRHPAVLYRPRRATALPADHAGSSWRGAGVRAAGDLRGPGAAGGGVYPGQRMGGAGGARRG